MQGSHRCAHVGWLGVMVCGQTPGTQNVSCSILSSTGLGLWDFEAVEGSHLPRTAERLAFTTEVEMAVALYTQQWRRSALRASGHWLHHETPARSSPKYITIVTIALGKPAAEQMNYLGVVFLCVGSCWCSEGSKCTLHHLSWKLSSLEAAIPHQEPKASSTRASSDSSSSPEGVCLIVHRRRAKSHV